MSRLLLALAVALPLVLPAPVAAATWAFGGTTGNFASVNSTLAGSVFIKAEARRFDGSIAPNALTNLSQLNDLSSTSTALAVNRTTPGIGINGGASNPQIDTNNTNQREAMLLTVNDLISLKGLQLSYIDNDDTLQIYGVNADNTLTSLGFGGIIQTGLGGAATFTNSPGNDGTTVLTFLNDQIGFYSKYVFTTRLPGSPAGQGYRIDKVVAEILPEPGSWALLITGFGLVGGMMRRERAARGALA